jgi:prepilin-type N-terminal cleavage/methylation domain-containing protein
MHRIPVSRSRRVSGFTLVELLVVIGIIAILAAVTMNIGVTVIKSAKRAKAANTATQIQTAALGYYTEYSVYPVPTGTAAGDYFLDDTTGSKTGWLNVIQALCGNVSPSNPGTPVTPTVPNTRAIAFLSMKASDVGTSAAGTQDCPLNPLPTATNLFFNLAIDNDYDGLLGTTGNTSGKLVNFTKSSIGLIDMTGTSTAGVAVWEDCNGPGAVHNNPAFWVHTY